jgi:transposase InsO family protein
MGTSTFSGWLKKYREQGEEGLRFLLPLGGGGSKKRSRLPGPVVEKILELKRQNPWWGIKRIAQALRRMFFLQASAESVRTRLHEAGLMPRQQQRRAKGKRNLSRPRFFERSTPNQMWQSDIFTFRLGGRYAYLIAFLDDYSRFVVGADLFRSPTAQAVIEVYRVAAGEYQPPKEMLTDNGRQYASWRGSSRFEWEMKKDRVIHIKSRPQHPMTLGKVERFWATIWQDFLVRAQFESFESAKERIKLWIKYYNHRKPHQGIGGLCPADRYFEIQSELRRTIEAGIKSNLLEMALRGQPRAPFYMVGRMEGQSVVLRAEKGKLRLSVGDDQQQNQTKELEYDLNNKGEEKNEKGNQCIKPSEVDDKQSGAQTTNALAQLQCAGESAGGAGSVDREGASGADLPRVIHQPDQLPSMAATGDGGNAPSAGEPGESGRWRSVESALAEAPGQAPACKSSNLSALHSAGEHPERATPSRERQSTTSLNEKQKTESPATGERDPASTLGPDQRERGSALVRHLAQDLLPMGEAGAQGHASRAGEASAGAPPQTNRLEAGGDPKEDRQAGSATQSSQPDGASASDPALHAQEAGEGRS